MSLEKDYPGHPALTGGSNTTLHSHAGGSGADFKPYKVYDAIGNQEIDQTERTVNLDTEEIANANYSLASDAITIVAAGTYLISYTISIEQLNTSGGTRSMSNYWIDSDDSGSYTEIKGSFLAIYGRETCIDEHGGNNATFLFVQSNPNKKIRIQSIQPNTSGTNVDTMAGRTSVSIVKVV